MCNVKEYKWYSIHIDWCIKKNWKNVNKYLSNNWYHLVSIKWKIYSVHRLIMRVFIWNSELVVNHKNWIKTDNRLDNLEYCTRSQNAKHRFKELWHKWSHKWKFWKLNHRAIKVKQLSKNWELIKIWDSIMDIYRELWLTHISEVCRGKRKTDWWYKWEYFRQ